MFIISTKENSGQTYAISEDEMEVKKKFKVIFSKVQDLKSNFMVVTNTVRIGIVETDSFMP